MVVFGAYFVLTHYTGDTTRFGREAGSATAHADSDRAADMAFGDALDAGDFAATNEVVRTQISFIEVYVLRVLAVLGLAVPVPDGSWWRVWPAKPPAVPVDPNARPHRPAVGPRARRIDGRECRCAPAVIPSGRNHVSHAGRFSS